MTQQDYDLHRDPSAAVPACEVDFIAIQPRTYPGKASLIIGECKDEADRVNANDIENLRRVADAVPSHRFDTYILLARLSPFSDEEVALARMLNDDFHQCAILLSARELEPYHFYDRVNDELGLQLHGSTAEELARTTAEIYFRDRAPTLAGA